MTRGLSDSGSFRIKVYNNNFDITQEMKDVETEIFLLLCQSRAFPVVVQDNLHRPGEDWMRVPSGPCWDS